MPAQEVCEPFHRIKRSYVKDRIYPYYIKLGFKKWGPKKEKKNDYLKVRSEKAVVKNILRVRQEIEIIKIVIKYKLGFWKVRGKKTRKFLILWLAGTE